jgi:hypothetical protein
MSTVNSRLTELFEEFKNTSNPRLIRAGQTGDAFTLLVFETLFQEHHFIPRLSQAKHFATLAKSIVPPADDGIDIFFEEPGLDDPTFHVVQCKYEKLDRSKIETCFLRMKNAVDTYVKPRTFKRIYAMLSAIRLSTRNTRISASITSRMPERRTQYVINAITKRS